MSRFVAVIALAGCSSPADVLTARQIPADMQPDVAEVVTSNNQFAVDAYARLVTNDENLVFSPFSISTAFAMLDAGAAGDTDTELRSALHFTLPGDRMHSAYSALLTSLATGRDFHAYTLATASRLFGQDGFPFDQGFLTITKDDYGAEMLPVDFVGDSEGAIRTIDQWVSDQTDAKIPMLFQSGDLDANTVLALVNAILFKGTWADKFDHDATADAAFTKPDGSTVTASMMHQTSSAISYGAIPGGRIAVLPFDGKDLEMVVLLPEDAAGLPALEVQLTGANIQDWVAGALPTEEAEISLPKFAVTTDADLSQTMQALGVHAAFDHETADLSGITTAEHLFVQKAVHKAVISVDEDGAEAAAATGIGAGANSARLPFEADHAFVYAIYDAVTDSILFMGHVVDPTK